MIISRTPFRVSFFGGGTDYPSWFQKHGGAVLATTIDKYCYISCRYLPPFFEHRIRLVYSQIENCQSIDEIIHPAAREVLRYLNIDRGVEIHHDGDLPARSGMGTSSSFTVGLLHSLYGLKGYMPSKEQLARESIYIEQEVLKENVGCQDQILAAFGGFNHITFLPNGAFSVRPITLSPERLREINAHLMLIYTGIKRTSSDIAATYVNDIERKRRHLRIMKDLIEESISILNNGSDLKGFGELLHEAWQAKKGLSPAVSNSFVDEILENAISAGAIGGKLTGAGGGGFILLFVPPQKQAKVKERLKHLIHVPFKFESSGSQIIFFDREEDYENIGKVRQSQKIGKFRELALGALGET